MNATRLPGDLNAMLLCVAAAYGWMAEERRAFTRWAVTDIDTTTRFLSEEMERIRAQRAIAVGAQAEKAAQADDWTWSVDDDENLHVSVIVHGIGLAGSAVRRDGCTLDMVKGIASSLAADIVNRDSTPTPTPPASAGLPVQECRYCGSADIRVEAGTVTHAAGMRCGDCGRHAGWVPKAIAATPEFQRMAREHAIKAMEDTK